MKKVFLIFPIILCLFFTSCNIPKTPKSKFVTKLSVKVQENDQPLYRQYTDPQKIETILYYLRAMDGPPTACKEPERYCGPQYRIELTYCDGSKSYIFQHANRFLSKNFHPWQELNPNHAAFLLPLTKSMPSD